MVLRYLTIGHVISQKAEEALNQDIFVDSLLIARENVQEKVRRIQNVTM